MCYRQFLIVVFMCYLVLHQTAGKELPVKTPIEYQKGYEGDDPKDLSGAESQSSYGYGYGTKVQDEHSVATVYVHGFGTSDYEDPYTYTPHHALPKVDAPPHPPPYVPVYRPPVPKAEPLPAPPPSLPQPHPNVIPTHYKKPYRPYKPYYPHKNHGYGYGHPQKPAYHGYPHSGYGYGNINEYGDANHGYGYNHPYQPYPYGPSKHAHGQHHGVIGAGPTAHPGPGPFHHGNRRAFSAPHLGPHQGRPHHGGPHHGGPHHAKPNPGYGHHASVHGAHLGSHQSYGFGSGSLGGHF